MSSYVYIIEAQGGLAKIGCARAPDQRLATVRTHSPLPTRLVAMWPGVIADEMALHRRFERQRTHSEWFRVEDEFLCFMAEVRGRGLDRIAAWDEVTYASHDTRKGLRAVRHSAAMKALWANPAFRIQKAKDKYFQDLMAPLRVRALNKEGPLTREVFQAASKQVERDFAFIGPRLPEISLPQLEFEKNSHPRIIVEAA